MDIDTQIKYCTLAASVIMPVLVGVVLYRLNKAKDFKMKQGELVSKIYILFADLYSASQDIMEVDADRERNIVAGKILMRNPATTNIVDLASYHYKLAEEKAIKKEELIDKWLDIHKQFSATLGTFVFFATKKDKLLLEKFNDKQKGMKAIKIVIPETVDLNNIISVSHEVLKTKLNELHQNVEECTDLLEQIMEK